MITVCIFESETINNFFRGFSLCTTSPLSSKKGEYLLSYNNFWLKANNNNKKR